MAKIQKPSPSTLEKTIRACVENGERILEESYDLEFRKPPSSRYFLVMMAQEEFAKAFILFLVREQIAVFDRPVLRAINDHACKQLVGMILDYMIMHWEEIEELETAIKNDADLCGRLPDDVASAMELLRYEKIGRWEANDWVWAKDPQYDASALRIAEGRKDRRKQDALYVRIGSDGRVCSTPHSITKDETHEELARADRYRHFIHSMMEDSASSRRYDTAMGALKLLFERQGR